MICITEEASVLINEMEEQNTAREHKLTLASAGVGCGAPVIKIKMQQPLEDDIVTEISGFTIHIRPSIERFLEGAEIIAEDSFWGRRLKVKTVNGCR